MDNPGNPNIHTIVKAQIVFLLSTLTEENFERNQLEIRSVSNIFHTKWSGILRISCIQLSEQHGIETYLHFIRRLIVQTNGRLATNGSNTTFDASSALTFRLLVQEVQRLARDPYLADRFRDGVDKGEGDAFRNFDLGRFVDRIGLRPLERVVLASSIVAAPTRKELTTQAVNLIRSDFENAVLALCQHPSFDHADLNPNQVAKLMSNLVCDVVPDGPLLDATQRQALIAATQSKYGLEILSPILQRLLPTMRFVFLPVRVSLDNKSHHRFSSLPPDTTLVQALVQLGPDITSDVDVIRALLTRFNIDESNPPTDDQVSDLFSNLTRLAGEGGILCDAGALVRALSSLVSDKRRFLGIR